MTTSRPQFDPNLARALAPHSCLRASINLGNPILAGRDANGQACGISVDLATELARRLDVPLELVVVDGAAKSVDNVRQQRADVGFFAIDPLRSAGLSFTAAYVHIEGSYLVRQNSPLQDGPAVDAAGIRVAVGRGSAYDLFLTRLLKQASIVRAEGGAGALAAFEADQLEVLAGIRQVLEAETRRQPGLRVLPGRFMVIEQAMGCPEPLGPIAAAQLAAFVEDMKANGFVAQAIALHRAEGAIVAPAA